MLSEQLRVEIQRNIAASLAEDIGTGDLTARLIAPDTEARGRVITREDAVVCGTAWFDAAFAALSPAAVVHWHVKDGDSVTAGQTLCEIAARARVLLTAERTALNFLQLLSGTATVTRRFVDAVAGTGDARARASGELGTAWSMYAQGRETLRLLEHTLLPQAQATRDASQAALSSGKVDFDSVIEAERQLIDIRTQRLKAELDTRLALTEIKKLTGDLK